MISRVRSALVPHLLSCGVAASINSSLAGPLSVGVSNQVQLGWVRTSQSATRVTRLVEQGTAGENIQPDGSTSFSIVGTPFVPAVAGQPFEYRSTLRDTTTVSDLQAESLTIYGTQTTTANTTNGSSLGYFDQGNSAF